MAKRITIEIVNTSANKLIKKLEEQNLIRIVSDPLLGLTGKKRIQGRNFLTAYKQAKLAESGKVKLKTAESLINEL